MTGGVPDGATDWVGVGVMKIIFMALSSGTGEMIFLAEITAPMTRITIAKKPIMMVTAASVFCRSFISLILIYEWY